MLHNIPVISAEFEKIRKNSNIIVAVNKGQIFPTPQKSDFIEVSCINDPDRIVQTRLSEIYVFNSMKELSVLCEEKQLNYITNYTVDPNKCYKNDNQGKGAVLGLLLRCTDLQRFIDAQNHGYSFGEKYSTALSEIKSGYKSTHWMWYVFPQIQFPGAIGNTAYFSIKDLSEAQNYYDHPLLRDRLLEIIKELLKLDSDDPVSVFGITDAFKLRACMTLFKYTAPDQKLFQLVLDKYCQGSEDERTLSMISRYD